MLKKESHMIAACMALLAVLFLSSVVPVGAEETPNATVRINTGGIYPVPLRVLDRFTDPLRPTEPPVEHTDFDIDAALDPWMNIIAYQLAIGMYDEEQRREEHSVESISEWTVRSVALAMLCTGLLSLLITVLWVVDRHKGNAA